MLIAACFAFCVTVVLGRYIDSWQEPYSQLYGDWFNVIARVLFCGLMPV